MYGGDNARVAVITGASSGIGLVTAKALHNAGGELHLAGANDNVMQIIRVAGYDTMFPVYNTIDDAIARSAALRARPATVPIGDRSRTC